MVMGHGEPLVPETKADGPRGIGVIVDRLRAENYQLRQVVLLAEPDVPRTCSAVVLLGPRRLLVAQERAALERYLVAGGRLVALLDPLPRAGAAGLEGLLAQWGIAVDRSIVLERTQTTSLDEAGFGTHVIVRSYGRHAITRSFSQPTVFPFVAVVRPTAAQPAGVRLQVLAETSPTSWAETDFEALRTGRASWTDGDRQGPVPVAVAASKVQLLTPVGGGPGQRSTETRLVVIGDLDFVTNSYVDTFYNADLFLSAVAWAAGLEQRIALRPKITRASRIDMSVEERLRIFYLLLVYVPEAILLGGLAMIWLRRTE